MIWFVLVVITGAIVIHKLSTIAVGLLLIVVGWVFMSIARDAHQDRLQARRDRELARGVYYRRDEYGQIEDDGTDPFEDERRRRQ